MVSPPPRAGALVSSEPSRPSHHHALARILPAAVQKSEEQQHRGANLLLSLAASAALVLGAGPATADSNVKLPPLDNGAWACIKKHPMQICMWGILCMHAARGAQEATRMQARRLGLE